MSSSSSSDFDARPVKVIIKKKKKVVIKSEIESGEESRHCNVEDCKEKKHGKFDECKEHFMKRHLTERTFKWSPKEVGYRNILKILRCYPYVYEIDQLEVNHMNNGSKSKIPITCLKCNHKWKVAIGHLINNGTGCPECAGSIRWNLERFKDRMSERTNINISRIKEKDIVNQNSHVKVSCNTCHHEWSPTIGHLTGDKTGCPSCAGHIPWNLKTFTKAMKKFSNINISEIGEKDIAGENSRVKVFCNRCNHLWSPIIGSLVRGHGCPACYGNIPWSLNRFKEAMRERKEINIDRVTEEHIKGVKSKIPLSCNICDYSWNPVLSSTLRDYGCPNCAGNAPYTFEMFEARMLDRPEINISKVTKEHIKGVKSKIPIKCNGCNYDWECAIYHLIKDKSGCPNCVNKAPYTLKIFLEKIKDRDDIDVSRVMEEHVENSNSCIPIKCKRCKFKWNPKISSLIHKKSGCPRCKTSKAIRFMTKYLNDSKTDFEIEKTFKDLIYNGKLRVDIYISEIEGIRYPICLEYDGNFPGSHFSYNTDEERENHILTVKRDKIKDKYAKDNKIHMIRIPYTCFPNNSEEKLKETLEEALEILKTKKKPYLCLMNEDLYRKRDENLPEE